MPMSSTTLRAGLYAEQVAGLRLTGTAREQTLDQRALADDVAEAIREAMASARLAGLGAFEPDSDLLVLPSTSQDYTNSVRVLFAEVLGVPYSAEDELAYPGLPPYGPLSLAQWSNAERSLEEYSARLGSMLAPGEGGGAQYARGHWFVNGQPFSAAELFMTIRMGNLNNLDKVLESDLNAMVVNTNLARQLMAVLADMKLRRGRKDLEVANSNYAPTTSPVRLAAIDENSGARVITTAELLDLARDPENDTLAVSNVAISSGNGTLANNNDGTWTYTPALNDNTSVSFSYIITDNGTTNGVADPKSVAGSATLDITPETDVIILMSLSATAGNDEDGGSVTYTATQTSADEGKLVMFDAVADYQAFVEAAGLTVEELSELGTRFKGENSYLARAGLRAEANGEFSESEYDDTISEMQSLFDSINSQNDVKRVQIEARQNERINMLQGMSDFYQGLSHTGLIVGQNLARG